MSSGTELRRKRHEARLSQWEVAKGLGKTQGWLSCVELGYLQPSEQVMRHIETTIEKLKNSGLEEKSGAGNS